MNFVTVKIGEKYTSTYVNRVFEMCQKHVNFPFTFCCYTDDPTGINPLIEIIPFIDHGLETIVHNKLFLFSKEFEKLLCSSGPRIFLDLDVVIRDNIDTLIEYAFTTKERLSVINASWKQYTHKDLQSNVNLHTINSSCMVWNPYENTHIWNHFIEGYSTFSTKYDKGMDAYLVHEHNIFGKLPEHLFCSYLHGVPKKYVRLVKTFDQYKIIQRSFPIVLFNGPTTEEDLTAFVESNYTTSFFDTPSMFAEDKQQREEAIKIAERQLYERVISLR